FINHVNNNDIQQYPTYQRLSSSTDLIMNHFNSLELSSKLYSDKIITVVYCQTIFNNDINYWNELINILNKKNLIIKSVLLGLGCAKSIEQINNYLDQYCLQPSSSTIAAWTCLKIIMNTPNGLDIAIERFKKLWPILEKQVDLNYELIEFFLQINLKEHKNNIRYWLNNSSTNNNEIIPYKYKNLILDILIWNDLWSEKNLDELNRWFDEEIQRN
ncbi:unnamed protein product, partial [Didymodactylos carnosus]